MNNISLKTFKKDKLWYTYVKRARNCMAELLDSSWALGDIINQVSTTYGEKTLRTFAGDIGISLPSVYNYKLLSNSFPIEARLKYLKDHPNLSTSHLLILAKQHLPKELVEKYLKEASDKSLSVKQLQNLIKQEKDRRE